MNSKTKKLCILGMFCALAFVLVLLWPAALKHLVAAAPYLNYEPKDVVIAIAGLLFGPLAALEVAVVSSVLEMITISSTGIIGCVMNILASASFACVASLIYKKKHTLSGAIIGLVAGCLSMTIVMVLWNYLLTPLYTPYMSRADIAALLIPVFAPFNLVKSGLNAAITMLLYKPVVGALRRSGLVEPSEDAESKTGNKIGVTIVTVVVLATFIFLALVLGGVL